MSIRTVLSSVLLLTAMAVFAPAAMAHDWHNDNRNQWQTSRGFHTPGQERAYYNHRIVPRPVIVNRYVAPRPVYYQSYYQPVRYVPRYHVGQRAVFYNPVPYPVLTRLNPAPYGYYYASCDRDVYLVRGYDNAIVQVLAMLLN